MGSRGPGLAVSELPAAVTGEGRPKLLRGLEAYLDAAAGGGPPRPHLSLSSRRTSPLMCLERAQLGLLWNSTRIVSPEMVTGPLGPLRASWTGRKCWEVSLFSGGEGAKLLL